VQRGALHAQIVTNVPFKAVQVLDHSRPVQKKRARDGWTPPDCHRQSLSGSSPDAYGGPTGTSFTACFNIRLSFAIVYVPPAYRFRPQSPRPRAQP